MYQLLTGMDAFNPLQRALSELGLERRVHCCLITDYEFEKGAINWGGTLQRLGLLPEQKGLMNVDRREAKETLVWVLCRNLAYRGDVLMREEEATALAETFLCQFGAADTKYYSNGHWKSHFTQVSFSWTPLTSAAFDAGVVVKSGNLAGCLWVRDED